VSRLMAHPTLGIAPRITARPVARVTRHYLEQVEQLPADSYVEVRYEDLCTDADAALDRILSFLDVRPTVATSARAFISPRAPRVSDEMASAYRRVGPALTAYCSAHGYTDR